MSNIPNNGSNGRNNTNFNKNSYYSKKGLFSTSEKPKIVFLKKKLSGSVLKFSKVKSGNKFLNSNLTPKEGDYYKIDYSDFQKTQNNISPESYVKSCVKKFIDEYYILAEIKGELKNLSVDRLVNDIVLQSKTTRYPSSQSVFTSKLFVYSLKDDKNKTINNLKLIVNPNITILSARLAEVTRGSSNIYETNFYFFISKKSNRNRNNNG